MSIDDILNIYDRPSSPVPSCASSNKVEFRNRDKFRNQFKSRPESFCATEQSSFDENSQSQIENIALLEHRLKVLESNFNQIIMTQNSDDKLVQVCLDKYKEQFQKTDQYINVLFEEILNLLNKIVNCLNDMPVKSLSDFRMSSLKSNRSSLDENNDSEYMDDCVAQSQVYLTKTNKKYLQDNLNNLNKTIGLLRKNMIDLTITSSMIGGLKQVNNF